MMPFGVMSKVFLMSSYKLFMVKFAGAEIVHMNGNRFRYADRISELNFDFAAESRQRRYFLPRSDAIYDAERSTFVGSLPEKQPPPWLPTPPYVSTMIFRPGKARVSHRSAGNKPSRRINMVNNRLLVEKLFRNHRPDYFFNDVFAKVISPVSTESTPGRKKSSSITWFPAGS